MPVGIQVFNDSGAIQIDSEHRNLRLISSGVTQCNGVWGYSGQVGSIVYRIRSGDITVSAANPVVAFRCSLPCTLVATGPNSFRFLVQNPEPAIGGPTPTGPSVEWWSFSVSSESPEGVGIQIFNSAGLQTFDSSDKCVKVFGVYVPPVLTDGAPIDGPNYYAVSKLAVVMCNTSFQIRGRAASGGVVWDVNTYMIEMQFQNSARVLKRQITEANTVRPPDRNLVPVSYLLIDVGGM